MYFTESYTTINAFLYTIKY